jgi:putative chitobiose transport system substrate-binding protein
VFNSPAAVARLQWYVDLFQQDEVPRDALTQGYQGALDRYTQGDLGMLFSGPQFLKKVHDNEESTYDVSRVAPLPPNPAGIVAAATMNFVVPRASQHRQQAVTLAEFLTNDENQLNFCKRGVPILPSRIAATHDKYFTAMQGKEPRDKATLLCLQEIDKAQDLSLGLPHEQDLSRSIREALEGALLGRKTAQQALDDAVAQWNVILEAPP